MQVSPKYFIYYRKNRNKILQKIGKNKKYYRGKGSDLYNPFFLIFSKFDPVDPKWKIRAILDAEQDTLGYVEYPLSSLLSPRVRLLKNAVNMLEKEGLVSRIDLPPYKEDLNLFQYLNLLKRIFYVEGKKELTYGGYRFIILDPLNLIEVSEGYSCASLAILMILDYIYLKGGRILKLDITENLGISKNFSREALKVLYSLGFTFSNKSYVSVRRENLYKIQEYIELFNHKMIEIAKLLNEMSSRFASVLGVSVDQRIAADIYFLGRISNPAADLNKKEKDIITCLNKFPGFSKILLNELHLIEKNSIELLYNIGLLRPF